MSALERFVAAQDAGQTYAHALAELRAGQKRTHWMWYIFPQISGLGFSDMAQRYGIADRAEAAAYLAHPVLGPRLRECAQALLALSGHDPVAILGSVDALKLHSSTTLFATVAPDEKCFREVLERYYAGQPDGHTLQRLV